MFPTDIKLLQKKIHKVEEASLEWVASGCNNKKGWKDSYMLQVEMLGLKKAIEDILGREPKEKSTIPEGGYKANEMAVVMAQSTIGKTKLDDEALCTGD